MDELDHIEESFEPIISSGQSLRLQMKSQVEDFFEKTKARFMDHIERVLGDVHEMINDFSQPSYLDEVFTHFQMAKANHESEPTIQNELKARLAVENLLQVHRDPAFKHLVGINEVNEYLDFRESYFDSVLKEVRSIEIQTYKRFRDIKDMMRVKDLVQASCPNLQSSQNALLRLMRENLESARDDVHITGEKKKKIVLLFNRNSSMGHNIQKEPVEGFAKELQNKKDAKFKNQPLLLEILSILGNSEMRYISEKLFKVNTPSSIRVKKYKFKEFSEKNTSFSNKFVVQAFPIDQEYMSERYLFLRKTDLDNESTSTEGVLEHVTVQPGKIFLHNSFVKVPLGVSDLLFSASKKYFLVKYSSTKKVLVLTMTGSLIRTAFSTELSCGVKDAVFVDHKEHEKLIFVDGDNSLCVFDLETKTITYKSQKKTKSVHYLDCETVFVISQDLEFGLLSLESMSLDFTQVGQPKEPETNIRTGFDLDKCKVLY